MIGADSNELKVIGSITAMIRIGTYRFQARIHIIEGMKCKMLLSNEMFIDQVTYEKGRRLVFPGDHPPVPVMYKKFMRNAFLMQEIIIPKESYTLTRVKIRRAREVVKKKTHAIQSISNNRQIETEIEVQNDGTAIIPIFNLSIKEVRMTKFESIAKIISNGNPNEITNATEPIEYVDKEGMPDWMKANKEKIERMNKSIISGGNLPRT